MKKTILTFLIVALFPAVAFATAAGTATFSKLHESAEYVEYQWICVSDSSGNISTPTTTNSGDAKYNTPLSGRPERVIIEPGTGDLAPSDNYYIQLRVDSLTVDLSGKSTTALDNATTYMFGPITADEGYPVVLFNNVLYPYATGLGAANQVTFRVLIKK